MINGTFWIENSYNHSEFVNFSETAYPLHRQCLVYAHRAVGRLSLVTPT